MLIVLEGTKLERTHQWLGRVVNAYLASSRRWRPNAAESGGLSNGTAQKSRILTEG